MLLCKIQKDQAYLKNLALVFAWNRIRIEIFCFQIHDHEKVIWILLSWLKFSILLIQLSLLRYKIFLPNKVTSFDLKIIEWPLRSFSELTDWILTTSSVVLQFSGIVTQHIVNICFDNIFTAMVSRFLRFCWGLLSSATLVRSLLEIGKKKKHQQWPLQREATLLYVGKTIICTLTWNEAHLRFF